MPNVKEEGIKEVKANLYTILKMQDIEKVFEGLLATTQLCALLLGRNIKIVPHPE